MDDLNVAWIVLPIYDRDYQRGYGPPLAVFRTEEAAQDTIDGFVYKDAELVALPMMVGEIDNNKPWAKFFRLRWPKPEATDG